MQTKLANAIVKTVLQEDVFQFPLSRDELFDMLVADEPLSHVNSNDFNEELQRLIDQGTLFYYDDHYSCASDVKNKVSEKLAYLKHARNEYRTAEGVFSFFKRFDWVYLICMEFRKSPDMKMPILVFLEKTSENKFNRYLNWYLSFKRKKNKYTIQTLPVDKLVFQEKSLKNAHMILNTRPLVNRNQTYERMIHKNMWVFNHFTNYPVQKVSMEYRVEVNRAES